MAWANHIVAQAEQERLGERIANIHLPGQAVRARLWAEGVGLAPLQKIAGGMTSVRRNDREQNLDEMIGGSRLREPQRGSIVVDGPAGVDERPGNRRTRSRSAATRSAPAVPVGNIEGTEDTPLNRGRMPPQTILVSPAQQRNILPYTGTAPMTLPLTTSQGSHSLTAPGQQDLTETPSALPGTSNRQQ
jgi:hypothetical protein